MKSASTQGALKCAHLHDLSDGFRRLPAMVVLWIMHSQLAADQSNFDEINILARIPSIQSHIKHIVQYTIQATMQIHALSAKQVSKEAPRLTCQ